MLLKTIAKISCFVILTTVGSGVLASCALVSSGPNDAALNSPYLPPRVTGRIRSPEITESSGVAASRCQQNVLWTHNDSGDDAYIFAFDLAGENLGTWKLASVENIDWEDIASYKDNSGKCFIYIGETGDNKLHRREHTVYRFAEPLISDESRSTTKKTSLTIDMVEALQFVYPDTNQDAETLMIEPRTGDIYIVTKRVSGPAGVYRLKPSFGGSEIQRAEKVADIAVPAIPNGLVSGGDISPDGRRMVICDNIQAYEWTLPAAAANFDEIWKQTLVRIDLGNRKNGEAITYTAGGETLIATSEGRNSPITEVVRKK